MIKSVVPADLKLLTASNCKACFVQNEIQICDVLRDLIPFVQFKKREKHPWKSVNFSKVAGFSLQLY